MEHLNFLHIDGTKCAEGWLGYEGNCYKFSTAHQAFQDHAANCESEGSELVSVMDKNEHQFIQFAITGKTDFLLGHFAILFPRPEARLKW